MNPIKKILLKIKHVGIIKTCKILFSSIFDLYFDAKYNIDTVSWVSLSELDVEEDQKKHAVLYQGSRVLPLRNLFKELKIPSDKVFVDIGCGKGRVLIIAATFGFKDIKGIEFSPKLCALAEKNILKYRTKTKSNTHFEIINTDAALYHFNDDEDVLFLFNPFDEYILKKVMRNLADSIKRNARKVLIIYGNPFHRTIIEQHLNIVNAKNFKSWEFDVAVYEVE
jgi:SAM-dependent methyltransferase